MAPEKKPKLGTSRAASAQRKALFAEAYIAHGENGTRAAIALGVPEPGARVTACRWLSDANVRKAIEKRRAEARLKFAMTTDRVVHELQRVGLFNPKHLVNAETGKTIPLHELSDDTAAALASFESHETEVRGKGANRVVLTRVTKARPFNKVSALEKSVKILRLYDKPPPPPPDPTGHIVADPRETARRMIFLLAQGAAEAEKAQPARAKPKKKVVAA